MTNRAILRSSIAMALGYALLAAPALHAKPIRIDDGLAIGASGAWQPVLGLTFDTQTSLGLNLGFFGGTADTVSVNANGGISLFGGGVQLGSITAYGVLAEFPDAYVFDETLANPLPPVDGQAVTDAFRVRWSLANGFESQLALFTAANGDSFVEFNYWDGFNLSDGLDLSGSSAALGVISNTAGTQFDLGSYLTANQSGCLATLGAFNDDTLPDPSTPTPGTGCTAYFVDGAFSSTLLPPSFQVANAGTAEEFNPVANYRYLVRLTGATTPPPTQVPEPSVLSLLLGSLAVSGFGWRRRWRRA